MSQAQLRKVEEMAAQLNAEEQLMLMERLAQRLQQRSRSNAPQDLQGIWKGRFKEDFDLDATLREIRSSWQREE